MLLLFSWDELVGDGVVFHEGIVANHRGMAQFLHRL